jgi:putative transposase
MLLETKKVIKLRLYPDQAAAAALDGQSRICNWLYNQLLDKANQLKDQFKQTQDNAVSLVLYSKRGLRNQIPAVKKENPFLQVVHSSPLKNAALRLSASIQDHQKSKKGRRKGMITGWPQFRSWKQEWFSLLYDEPKKGFKIKNDNLILSLGSGVDKQQRYLTLPLEKSNALKDKTIATLRILKQAGEFFAVFTVTHALPETKPLQRMLVIDPNHKNLGVGVDNLGSAIEIAAPSWLKTFDKRIDELKSKRDKCQRHSQLKAVLDDKGNPTGKKYWQASKRWEKFNTVLDTVYAKRREQTKTYGYTIANKLYRDYDCIAVGNYTPQGGGLTRAMRRAMNNRSLIGRFKQTLSWVASRSGKHYREYDEKGTTRTCHHCDYIVIEGLNPSIRQWDCPNCQSIHNRDENSAINGFHRILKEMQEKNEAKALLVPSSGRVSIKKRWAWRVLPSGVHCALRGQNSDLVHKRQEIKTRAWEPLIQG